MADVSAPAPDIQPESVPMTGQLTPPSAPPTPAPTPQPAPAVPVPAKPGQTFSNLSHALIGGVLGAMAGPQPNEGYTVNPEGQTQANPQAPDSTSQKLRRIANAALIGLAAGSQTQGDPLGALGEGMLARQQQAQGQDKEKRKQASDEFEQQQKALLQKHEIARQNALTGSTYYANMKAANEMSPQFAANENLLKSVQASTDLGPHAHEMTAEQVGQLQAKDQNFSTTHIVRPLGRAPLMDEQGKQVLDAEGIPQSYMRMAVLDATKNGKFAVTPEMAKEFQEYGADAMIPNAKDVKAGQEYSWDEILPLMNAIDGQKKNVVDGWQKSTFGWAPDEKGNLTVPVEVNGNKKNLTRPFVGSVPDAVVEAKGKQGLTAAQTEEQRAMAREHLATAAQELSNVQANGDLLKDPAYAQKLSETISSLPPVAQAMVRTYPLATVNDIILMANGDTKQKSVFPQRNYKLAGGLTEQQAVGIAKEINPHYNEFYADQKAEAVKELLGDKKTGQAIKSFNQFFVHSADALQASKNLERTGSPWLDKSINAIKKNGMGQPGIPELMTGLQAARTEWTNFLASGYVPSSGEKDAGEVLLNDASSPRAVIGVLRTMGRQGIGRVDQINENFKTVWGSNIPNLITPSGRQAINDLGLGDEIQKYNTGGMIPGAPNPSSSQNGQTGGSYKTTATNPANQHKIGSNDNGATWFDVQTGQPLAAPQAK